MKAKSRVETPVSAGGVVYRRNGGQLETVLCGRSKPVRWSLAKGTPAPGESMESPEQAQNFHHIYQKYTKDHRTE